MLKNSGIIMQMKNFTIRLKKDQYTALNERAVKEGKPVSVILRELIDNYLQEKE